MRMIKVLQFPMANAYGGITQYALQNWRFIDKSKFLFDFATLSKEKLYFEQEVTDQGCKVFHLSCYAEENEEQFSAEMRKILSESYDVVHLHTSFWKSFRVEELAREAGIPKIIVHAHNTNVLGVDNRQEQIKRHNQCVKELNEMVATDFWACSREAANWLFGDSISKEKIVIQRNAVDVDHFRYNSETAAKLRKELGWQNNFVIGHVGRFTNQKNHDFLMRVFKDVYSAIPYARLLLVGVGPNEQAIRAKIQNWDLQGKVRILGMRNDVNQLLQAVDVFAFPSRFEGLGISLIEAQAAGCVCLASDVIPKEAFLTPDCKALPLLEDIWIEEIIKVFNSGVIRHPENADIVCSYGYDMKDQIQRIEAGYEGKNG